MSEDRKASSPIVDIELISDYELINAKGNSGKKIRTNVSKQNGKKF